MGAGLLANALLLATVAAPVCTEVPTLDLRHYRNVDYEFSVEIPRSLLACMVSPPCPNHGLWTPLEPVSSCIDSHDGHRYIDVDAEYNTAFEATTPARLAAVECRWRGARYIVWLRGERISGRNAAGCRRDFPDGHVEVRLIVLRKTEPWRARWIQISADLVTTPARYRADMRVFRRVLRGIWVHPDGPLR
jgi:hypothetical protein